MTLSVLSFTVARKPIVVNFLWYSIWIMGAEFLVLLGRGQEAKSMEFLKIVQYY